MRYNTAEIMDRGMACLVEKLGVVEAEHLISVILRENFDYESAGQIGNGRCLTHRQSTRGMRQCFLRKKAASLLFNRPAAFFSGRCPPRDAPINSKAYPLRGSLRFLHSARRRIPFRCPAGSRL